MKAAKVQKETAVWMIWNRPAVEAAVQGRIITFTRKASAVFRATMQSARTTNLAVINMACAACQRKAVVMAANAALEHASPAEIRKQRAIPVEEMLVPVAVMPIVFRQMILMARTAQFGSSKCSTKTGVAPLRTIAFAVETKV